MSMLLEVNGISVSFDGFKAINDLSFSIGYNELRAIMVQTELEKQLLWT